MIQSRSRDRPGGVGFTMSLFIASLAFGGAPTMLTAAKLGTFLASVVAGVVGWLLLRSTPNHAGVRAPAPLSSL